LIWTGCWLGSRLLHRVRIEGLEHLPEGGCLVASNHQSFIDIPLLAAVIPRHVSFVARDSLAKSKPLAYIMERCGAVLVKRGASDRRAMREMSTHLKLGDCISIFPEGTRSIDGKVGEFKGGALLAARMAGVPIVPAAIRGGLRVLPRGKSFPRLAKLAVTFGSPIEPKAPDALERLQEAVEAMVGDGEIR
jgi:1-acyl-sn-glycerol-3-phosphate acyltransferase